MRIRLLVVPLVLGLSLGLGACGGGDDGPAAPGPATTGDRGSARLVLEREVVATGLEVPWGVAFRGGRDILVSERGGRIRLVRDGELVPEPVAELEVAAVGEAGLLGLAVHPDGSFLYAYYTHPSGQNRVVRFALSAGGAAGLSLGEQEVLLDGIPAAQVHDGGRIAFGPDGMLYVTTGDAGASELAANRASLAGKILRLRPDGGVPGDNPRRSPVWSYGHRNPQGIDWDDEGRLYASEHGPTGELGACCLDEVNLIEEGAFYGWPLRMGGEAVSSGAVEVADEPVEPLATSGGDVTWAPGGLAVHSASRSLLLPNLRGEQLLRLVLAGGDPGRAELEEVLLDDLGRLRTIVRGPDDCFYLTTSNRDGRGSPREGDDKLLRLCPAD